MGLDIIAYRGLVHVPGLTMDDLDPRFDRTHWTPGVHKTVTDRDFPGHSAGLHPDPDAVYTFTDSMSFRAGSYSGYSGWRQGLADVSGWTFQAKNAGYNDVYDLLDAYPDLMDQHPFPFVELIYFSDCEGVIGPIVSKKLLNDFDTHPNIKIMSGNFQKFYEAFTFGADNGVVQFC